MSEPKRAEPLVKTAVALTRDQLERLRRRGARVGGSVSYYVRNAIEETYPEDGAETTEREERSA